MTHSSIFPILTAQCCIDLLNASSANVSNPVVPVQQIGWNLTWIDWRQNVFNSKWL